MKFSTKKLLAILDSSRLVRFSKRCYEAMFSGFFGSMLTNYSKRQKQFESGIIGSSEKRAKSWKDSVFSRARRAMIVSYENSRILSVFSAFRDWLLCTGMKFYGFFFLYFGLCVILVNLVKRFAFSTDMSTFFAWALGTASVVVAFPMLACGKTLAQSIHESNIFSFLFEKALGCSFFEPQERVEGVASRRYFYAALAGAALGCTSYFISPRRSGAGLQIAAYRCYNKRFCGAFSCVPAVTVNTSCAYRYLHVHLHLHQEISWQAFSEIRDFRCVRFDIYGAYAYGI